MSAVIEKFLVCNICGTSFGVDSRHLTIEEHRKMSRVYGWSSEGKKDFCNVCKTKEKSAVNLTKQYAK